ncbi:MAG TPA: mechanosensitive ion channel domain-containing protein [Gemmata sp.]
MLFTRIRPTAAVLLVGACGLLCGPGRSDEKEKSPAPKADPAQARKEFEAHVAGRTAEELRPFVEHLANEWSGHKGAVEVARSRLTARADEAAKARQQVTDLKAPPAAPVALQPDDAAVRAEQTRVDFLAARVRNLEALKGALAATVSAGAEFDRTARAADEHLFKLRAATAAATKAGVADPPIAPKQLDDAGAQLRTRTQGARALVEKARSDLGAIEKELADAQANVTAGSAQLDALKLAQADAGAVSKFQNLVRLMTPVQLGDEVTKLQKVLAEKVTAAEGDSRDYRAAVATVAEARKALASTKEPLPPAGADLFGANATLAQAAEKLTVSQQYLAARLRTADESADKTKSLVAALDELEKKAVALSTTLEDARRAITQLGILATEVGRRVALGDLDPAQAPDASVSANRDTLAADAARVTKALADLRQEREALRKPDPDADNIKALTTQLLARVTERLALLNELKKLAAGAATAHKDRPEAEQKRLELRAAERLAREAPEWDRALALDRSKPALDAADLLAAYYRELTETEERAENLARQKDALERLVELTAREAADAAKLRTVLERHTGSSEEARTWDEWLRVRLSPSGLRSEAGVYLGEIARLNAVAASGTRRVEALTGNAAPDPTKPLDQTKLAATGGEIGRARAELQAARLRGLQVTGFKIGIILFAALLVPPIVMWVLRRAIRGGTDAAGNPSPVLGPLRSVLRAATWVAAVALVLSTLGYDVTALVIALAIGALAVALAARPMIADVLGSVVIFAERRFMVGDVVRLSGAEAARVVGITWRSTALKAPNGLVFSVPNRKVTEATLENLSKGTETYDTLAVTVSTDKDAGKVIGVIRGAVSQCKNVSADNGVTVVRYTQKGNLKVVDYRFWWFLKDYETRNKTRDEVFARIALGLAHEDMAGIEVTLG